MARLVRFLICALLALFFSATARAQMASPEPDIVVTAPTIETLVDAFVEELSATSSTTDSMARWGRRVCSRVFGLNERQGQYVADSIARRALQFGMAPGRSGCRPNMFVLITPNARELTLVLARNRAFMAFYGESETAQEYRGQTLDDLVQSDAPVRWWHMTQTTSLNGERVAIEGEVTYGESAELRYHVGARQDFNHVVVIVDSEKARGVRFDALVDYISMVALAQIDPRADTSGFDSILNLFSARDAPPTAMTAWDLGYLEGLYSMSRWRGREDQEADIVRTMLETVKAPE